MADTADKLLNGEGLAEVWNILEDKYGLYHLHWWSKYTKPGSGYLGVETKLDKNLVLVQNGTSTIYYASSYTVNQTTGAISLVSPQSKTLSLSYNFTYDWDDEAYSDEECDYIREQAVTVANQVKALAPCYFTIGSGGTVYHLPSGATVGTEKDYTTVSGWCEQGNDYLMYGAVTAPYGANNPVMKIVAHPYTEEIGAVSLINSPDRNAYPDDGERDGQVYQYLGIPFDKLPAAPRLRKTSYVGTGTYGSANKNTLTFEFKPMLVLIIRPETGACGMLWGQGNPKGAFLSGAMCDLAWTTDTLSWYHASSAANQANENNVTYEVYYIG